MGPQNREVDYADIDSKGVITSFWIPIEINGHQRSAKIDSGAEVSVMDKSDFDTVCVGAGRVIQLSQKELPTLRGIGGGADLLGMAHIPLSVNELGLHTVELFAVVKDVNKILLGAPFLSRNSADLLTTQNALRLGTRSITCRPTKISVDMADIILPKADEAEE